MEKRKEELFVGYVVFANEFHNGILVATTPIAFCNCKETAKQLVAASPLNYFYTAVEPGSFLVPDFLELDD